MKKIIFSIKRTVPFYELDDADSTFRTVKIDAEGFGVLPLYNNNPSGVDFCRTIYQIKDNYESIGLLMAINGTYTGTDDNERIPLGDILGRCWTENNIHKWYRWDQSSTDTIKLYKRWYFAIKTDGTPEIKHLIDSHTPPEWDDADSGYNRDSESNASLKRNYRMILHGGILLFNANHPMPKTLVDFKKQMNKWNDRFQGGDDSAYLQIGNGNPHASWGIGICQGHPYDPDKYIVVVSSGEGKESTESGMPIYNLAQRISQTTVKGKKVIACVFFDGRSPHTMWAAQSPEKSLPPEPQAKSAANGRYYNTNYLSIIYNPNVIITKIAKEKIPAEHSMNKPSLEILLDDYGKFTIHAKVKTSFKPTKRIELIVINRRTYLNEYLNGQPVAKDKFLGYAWLPPQGSNAFPTQTLKPITLKTEMVFKLITLTALNEGELIFIIRSLDNNDNNAKTIYDRAIPIKLLRTQLCLLLIQNTYVLHYMQIKNQVKNATSAIGSKIIRDGNSYAASHPGYSLKTGLTGYYICGGFASDIEEFGRITTGVISLADDPPSNMDQDEHYNAAGSIGTMLGRKLLLDSSSHQLMDKQVILFSTQIGGTEKDYQEFTKLLRLGITINCIGYRFRGGGFLGKIAKLFGGSYMIISKINKLGSAYQKIYQKCRKKKAIYNFNYSEIPDTPIIKKINFKKKKMKLLFRFNWDQNLPTPTITLRTPNGLNFCGGQSDDFVDYTSVKGYGIFTVKNTTPYLSGNRPWQIIISKGRRVRRTNTINFEVSEGEVVSLEPGPLPPIVEEDGVIWYFKWKKFLIPNQPDKVIVTSHNTADFSQIYSDLEYNDSIPGQKNASGDPRDGGIWFCHFNVVEKRFRIAKATLDGNLKDRAINVKGTVYNLSYYSPKNLLWLKTGQDVIIIKINSWRKTVCQKPFEKFLPISIAVNKSEGYTIAGAYKSGLYRFNTNGTCVAFNSNIPNPVLLTVCPEGDVICISRKQKTRSTFEYRLIRLDPRGTIKIESDPLPPTSYVELVVDDLNQMVWICNSQTVSGFDWQLQQNTEWHYKQNINIKSLALNYNTRGIIVSGILFEPPRNKSFVSSIDSSGNLLYFKTQAFDLQKNQNYLFTSKLPQKKENGI